MASASPSENGEVFVTGCPNGSNARRGGCARASLAELPGPTYWKFAPALLSCHSAMSLASMSQAPLTHHEILTIVAPFTRSGRRLDTGASDRADRCLRFQARQRSDVPLSLEETLQLENPDPDRYRLTRMLAHPAGLVAQLEIEGPDPAILLAAIDAVPAERAFVSGPGFLLAQSHRLTIESLASPLRASPPDLSALLILTGAEVRLGDLRLILAEPTRLGVRVGFELRATSGAEIAMPDDLMAVLGRDWSPLRRDADVWRGTLRLRGKDPARSRRAEHALTAGALHLATTFAEPPARFHERCVAARWVVVLRRALPLLACFALIGAAALVPRLHLAENSGLRMLIFNAPPILMMLFFCMRELPRIEVPPLPRRSRDAQWRAAPAS